MILLVLGSKHLHVTKPGSGTDSWLQKDLTKGPVAISWLIFKIPSCSKGCNFRMAATIKCGQVGELLHFHYRLPCAQRDNSFVAKLLGAELVDGVSPSVSAPRSISFFHPLSLFAFFMAEEVPFHKGSGRRALGWTFCKVSPCNPFARGVEAVLSQGLSLHARALARLLLVRPALLQGCPFCKGRASQQPFCKGVLLQGVRG